MRTTALIITLVLAAPTLAQEAEQEEEYTGPSWRDSRPERPELPDAPAMERPKFEFKVERPEFEVTEDFGGFKPRVAVEEVPDEPADDAAAELQGSVVDQSVAEQSASAIAAEEEPVTSEPVAPVEELVVEEEPVVEDVAAVEPPAAPVAAPIEEEAAPAVAQETVDETAEEPAEPAAEQPAQLAALTPNPTEPNLETLNRAPRQNATASLTPTRMVQPEYPAEAWRDRREGWVDVQLVIRGDGSVSDARALRADPRRVFDRSAVRAAMQWEFDPPAGLAPSETVTKTYRISFTMGEDQR